MSEEKKADDFVNVTDCLETISVFKSMKNLLFVVIFLCLVILGGCFVLADLGMVKMPGAPVDLNVNVETENNEILKNSEPNSVETAIAMAVKKVTQDSNDPNKVAKVTVTAEKEKTSETGNMFSIDYFYIAKAIRVCNFILFLSVVLYSLILAFSLKVSLVGRLGGMNHISRAFISSLFVLVFIFPWQKYVGPVCVGSIYLPVELKQAIMGKGDLNIFGLILYYVRFALWPIIVFLLMLSAQRRTAKWSNATLKRLGIE